MIFFSSKKFWLPQRKIRISHETSVLTEILPLKEGTDNNDYDINEDQSDRVYCTRKHREKQNSYCSQHNETKWQTKTFSFTVIQIFIF